MLKVFELRISESGLGRYNATKVHSVMVVASDSSSAIREVMTDNLIEVEVVSAHPVLICPRTGYENK